MSTNPPAGLSSAGFFCAQPYPLGGFLLHFLWRSAMRKFAIVGSAVLLVALAAVAIHAQQDKSKRPSPPATAKCDLGGGKSITVDYSSPRAKGRKVFGGIVPFGEVWRAGANEATTFVTTSDLTVGG